MSLAAPPRVSLHEWETTWNLVEDAYELVDGVPTMTPPEAGTNIEAAALLHERLAPLVRPGHRVLPNYGVHVRTADGRDTVRQPDLLVLPRDVDIARPHVEAHAAALVVEVVSPSSIERDWVTKRREYAAAGIPNYLIVDVRGDAPQLWLFEQVLADGPSEPTTYPPYPDPTGDGTCVTIHIPGCDPVTITAADLA